MLGVTRCFKDSLLALFFLLAIEVITKPNDMYSLCSIKFPLDVMPFLSMSSVHC